jgi:hypothetical protein
MGKVCCNQATLDILLSSLGLVVMVRIHVDDIITTFVT